MAPKLFQLPSSLQSRCQRKYGWEITFAKKALKGYQHFMKLKKLHEDWNATKLSPSIVIGQVWHMHMLDPRHYSNACQEYCDGEIIGHDPEGALDEETRKLRRNNTKIGLVSMLGKAALENDIWGSLDTLESATESESESEDTTEEDSDSEFEFETSTESIASHNRPRQEVVSSMARQEVVSSANVAPRIQLILVDQSGTEEFWTVERTAKIQLLFEKYASRRGVDVFKLRFSLESGRSGFYHHFGQETVGTLQLEDQDRIDVAPERITIIFRDQFGNQRTMKVMGTTKMHRMFECSCRHGSISFQRRKYFPQRSRNCRIDAASKP